MKSSNLLILAQSTSTFTENVMRAIAMVMAIEISTAGGLLATISFVLPYILFSPFAGELGERFSKTRLVFGYKVLELALLVMMVVSMHMDSCIIAIMATFFAGTLSSFASPVRLGLIPDLAGKDILRLSSLMDGFTFMAILLGTGVGLMRPIGDNSMIPHSMTIVTTLVSLSIAVGLLSAWRLCQVAPGKPSHYEAVSLSWIKTFRRMKAHVSSAGRWSDIWAISAFWGVASIMIAEAEPIAVSIGLHAEAVRFIVPLMAVGMGAGAIFTSITGFRNVCLCVLGMIVLCGIICLPIQGNIFLVFATEIFLLCFLAGIVSSVLYADLLKGAEGYAATIMASNNICNSAVMLLNAIVFIPMGQANPRVILFISISVALPIMMRLTKKRGHSCRGQMRKSSFAVR